jgi:hypothetical protein
MESIKRIKLIMGYDMTKTLNENKVALSIIEENDNEYDINEGEYDAMARSFETALKGAGEELPVLKSAIEDAANAGKPFKTTGKLPIKNIEEFEAALAKGEIPAVDLGRMRKTIINDASTAAEAKAAFRNSMTSDAGFIKKYNTVAYKDAKSIEAELTRKGYSPEQAKAMSEEFWTKKKAGKLGAPGPAAAGTTVAKDADAATAAGKDSKGKTQTQTQSGQGNVQAGRDANINNTTNITNNYMSKGVGDVRDIKKVGGTVAEDAAAVDKNIETAMKDEKVPTETKEKLENNRSKTKKISNWDKFKNTAKKVLSKKWLYALGIIGGGYLVLKWLFGGNTHPDIPEWPDCLSDVYNNGADNVELLGTKGGNPILHVKVTGRYPEVDKVGGVWLYTSGTVMSADGGKTKKGKWSCPAEAEETAATSEIPDETPLAEQTAPAEDNLGQLVITWDGEEAPKPITGGTTGDTTTLTGSTTTYKQCSDLPFAFGCKNDKIKEIQTCLGLESRYQTGNFGPITQDAISKKIADGTYKSMTAEAFKNNGILKELYDDIMQQCKGGATSGSTSGDTSTTSGTTSGATATTTGATSGNTATTSGATSGNTATTSGATATDTVAEGKTLYNSLRENKKNDTWPRIEVKGDGRIRFKGPQPSDADLSKLDAYIKTLGYNMIPQRDTQLDKTYGGQPGVKYVWEKPQEPTA